MAYRICFVLLCVFVLIGSVFGQVASLCRPNERFPILRGMPANLHESGRRTAWALARVGCYCDGDEVRNATGHCVNLSECSSIPSYKLHTSEPRPADARCPDNEEYRFCEPCNKTCDNPNPICPAQCARGCFCKADLVRDRDGRCVELNKCSKMMLEEKDPQIIKPVPYPIKKSCRFGEVYKECENCEKRCDDRNPQCPAQCARGCFCDNGLYRAPWGQCVQLIDCPMPDSTSS
ncbi:hypothetical protein ACJJTC_002388 [Scirpophaga incertulas]